MVTLFYRRDFLFSIYTKYFTLSEDPISIKMILKHYHGYITKLCLKNGFNEVGQFITYVDEYMLRQLEIKLIEAILKFKVN
ncbi:helix-turn-helix domain-containing protein [Enterococcus faecalis]